jgi:hypothetical protein
MDDPRYWTIDNDADTGAAASSATGMELEPLVDERAGGIIGYVSAEFADEIVRTLNRLEA